MKVSFKINGGRFFHPPPHPHPNSGFWSETKSTIERLLCTLCMHALHASSACFNEKRSLALYTFLEMLCMLPFAHWMLVLYVYSKLFFVVVALYINNCFFCLLNLKIKFCCPRGVRQNKRRKCRRRHFFLLNASSFFGSFRFGRSEVAKTKVIVYCSFLRLFVARQCYQEASGLTSEIEAKKDSDDWTTLNSFPHPGRSSQVTWLWWHKVTHHRDKCI